MSVRATTRIDSLCIVQDDVDDWEHEAVDMFRLYALAYVTIAASHGADGDTGILYEPTGRYHRVLDVELRAPGDVEAKPTTEYRDTSAALSTA
jgi:hypothetical protein